MTYIIL